MSIKPDHLHPVEALEEERIGHDQQVEIAEEADAGWLLEQEYEERPGSGGRAVLGWFLALLATAWVGFIGWTAGSTIGLASIDAPIAASWIAIAAGPLALLGLVWLMFGRTRRKEAEAFTRSVIEMRGEARSLDALLAVLRERIDDSQHQLRLTADQLMALGDEASARLGKTRNELDQSASHLSSHGEKLDRAASAARIDIGVLLEDLPRAEESARKMATSLRDAGQGAVEQAGALERQVTALRDRTSETDQILAQASANFAARLKELDSEGQAVAYRLANVADQSGESIDALLGRTSEALSEIRSGIDTQAQAVAALIEQSSGQIGTTSVEASEQLRTTIGEASSSLEGIAARVSEQDRAARQLVAAIDAGLGEIEHRFASFADQGDHRAMAIGTALAQVRADLESIEVQSGSSDQSIERLSGRISAVRDHVASLGSEIDSQLGKSLSEAEAGATRLREAAEAAGPVVISARDAAVEAGERLVLGADSIASQHERLGKMVASLDTGLSGVESQVAILAEAMAKAETDAARLSQETGPALIAALVQVKEAAAQASARAKEAISQVIPEASEQLSSSAREALERALQDSVSAQLAEVEQAAVRAVSAAQGATERLTQQMFSIGQSAAALEAHMAETEEAERERGSEAFARRVALLIESLHSASIDVGKILSDEVDDKAWEAYLKGDRGVFTRRAVRLLGSGEERALSAHYDTDLEFRDSVNRFIHDFEAMIRRVTGERDGGPMAVTMMSSDVGKLYTALAPLAGSRR